MKLAVIDYGAANLASVMFALERLDANAILTRDVDVIKSADKVLFPGVGAAKMSMENIQNRELADCIKSLKQPVMGICMGMQLLFNSSEEGGVDMFGVVNADVKHFDEVAGLSVPHMGWNTVKIEKDSPLFKNLDEESHFYFVHSYYAPQGIFTLASCDYANNFSAVIQQDNFYGCQFHPEKSGANGAQILKNFIEEEL